MLSTDILIFSKTNLFFSVTNTIEDKRFQSSPIRKGGLTTMENYCICQICGHTALGMKPEQCPICAAPKDKLLSDDDAKLIALNEQLHNYHKFVEANVTTPAPK